MTASSDPLLSIAVAPPNIDIRVVADAVADQFGLTGEYAALVSERDQNFRLTTANNVRYLVKVTSAAEPAAATDFQIAALRHLEKSGICGVPRIVQATSGADRGVIPASDGPALCLRVLSWVNGRLLAETKTRADVAAQLGYRLAELDLALESFDHEGDGQASLWDTQRAGQLRSLLGYVDDPGIRQHVEVVLNSFDDCVSPVLEALSVQAIHNDAHGENILLDANGDIAGIIDFGDLLQAPRIIEVSTAAAYLRPPGNDPLQLIDPFVAGYHRRSPLAVQEFDVLFDLIRTRQAISLILFYWRLSARGKEDSYLKKQVNSGADAPLFLHRLSAVGRAAFRARITQK